MMNKYHVIVYVHPDRELWQHGIWMSRIPAVGEFLAIESEDEKSYVYYKVDCIYQFLDADGMQLRHEIRVSFSHERLVGNSR